MGPRDARPMRYIASRNWKQPRRGAGMALSDATGNFVEPEGGEESRLREKKCEGIEPRSAPVYLAWAARVRAAFFAAEERLAAPLVAAPFFAAAERSAAVRREAALFA